MDRIRAEQPPQRTTKTSGLSLLGLSSNQSSNNDTNALELNESDVVWSFSANDDNNYLAIEESTSPTSSTSAISTASESPTTTGYGQNRRFGGEIRYGLSAVLAEENPPLVRRKASPSIGTATGSVRTMIPRSRKGSPSSGDGSIGYGSGRFNMSAPVNIPVWGKMRERRMRRFEEDEEEEEVMDGEKEMLRPHEVVAARSQAMTFSVFEGAGRTLKGRDLRRVRNAVFQQTGFLD